MTRQINFNGTVLVRAGGATVVNASGLQNLGISGLGTVGIIGEADGGLPGVLYAFTNAADMVNTFRSGPLADAADLLFRPMNDTRVPAGAQLVLAVKVNQSVQSSLSLSASSVVQITGTAKDAGAQTNRITSQVTTVGGGKVVQHVFQDGSASITETSPTLGATPDFMVQYVGTGSACTLTINGTSLATTVTGATGDSLNLSFASYPQLSDIIAALAANPAYAVTAKSGNPYVLAASSMDWKTAVAIKSAAVPVTTVLARMILWTNQNSRLVNWAKAVTATGLPPDDTAINGTPAGLPYTGGLRGMSANSNWQAGFDALGNADTRVNQTVPLICQDLTNEGNGSTATIASVAASASAYGAYYSSTAGKKEVQVYLGLKGTKSAVFALQQQINSTDVVLSSQIVTRPDHANNIVDFPEWGMACLQAGARAGSLVGEPLTFKTLRCNAVKQDASWNPTSNGAELILNGFTFAFLTPNRGYRFDRMTTSYTQADNDAYTEESLVTNWKGLAYDLRTRLEAIFTGTRGTPLSVRGVIDAMSDILEEYRQSGRIVDSTAQDGTPVRAYHDLGASITGGTLSAQATVQLVPGINFVLNTIYLAQARNAA